MDRVDAVVVGAGAVGLAVARELALRGRETIVLEADGRHRQRHQLAQQRGHPRRPLRRADSLKARLCVAGRRLLYPYCESRGVGHRRCGKLVVAATPAQVEPLRAIERRALANGVEGLRWLSGAEARELEPALRGEAALLSTATGIIDSHALMLAYLGDLENAGGALVVRSPLEGAVVARRRLRAARRRRRAARDRGRRARQRRRPARAGGRRAASTASTRRTMPRAWFAKGNYYALAGRSPFTRLIYPVPEPGGLGVHLTLDLAGQARFGPDVEWLDVDVARCDRLRRRPGARRRLLRRDPALLAGADGRRARAGVQRRAAEAAGAGRAGERLHAAGPEAHGVAGLVNLYGIESPGLTASLAIAAEVASMLDP